jgi:hypothetical protein
MRKSLSTLTALKTLPAQTILTLKGIFAKPTYPTQTPLRHTTMAPPAKLPTLPSQPTAQVTRVKTSLARPEQDEAIRLMQRHAVEYSSPHYATFTHIGIAALIAEVRSKK